MEPVGGERVRVHNLAVGQVAEWLVWTRVAAVSDGDLHVFLPLDDRGVDGIVHRISTDRYARVQVKGRTSHRYRTVRLNVLEDELADPEATLVAVSLDAALVGLGPCALVVNVVTFRELAHRHVGRAGVAYSTNLTLPPRRNSRWAPWCVPLDDIGDRLLARPAAPAATPPPAWATARRAGYRAETELIRRAADRGRLNVFKAFPDLEPNEYVLYDVETRGLIGIQVKSVTFRNGINEGKVNVYRPPLRVSAQTWFVIFLEASGETSFLEHCVVMPSAKVAEYTRGESALGRGTLPVTRGVTGRLAPWRVPREDLGARLVELASTGR